MKNRDNNDIKRMHLCNSLLPCYTRYGIFKIYISPVSPKMNSPEEPCYF